MATMRSKIEKCRSDGEKLIYQFFKETLSDKYHIWSNVELMITNEKRELLNPLFTLLSNFELFLDELE